ncbi:uncharacterized protein STEHIDRAFT_159400 [Stereum hirsutum FP-91666 SS1]|uniref:uncharacterized protein n=1 Tax=Stereum hirsutum (strain FP-91666) TaxID=721885 RepID=UPI000444988D|nr:uncharacterized protein STEHIDRAFT_159400 [Stereum hirsutum FP-91666 SS1]EIM83777.1 hypothetical protein STEHIDRAFT_159400 [Stereum hirsutum FP-91666 SS1]
MPRRTPRTSMIAQVCFTNLIRLLLAKHYAHLIAISYVFSVTFWLGTILSIGLEEYWQAPVGQITEVERRILSWLVNEILRTDISFQKTMITCEYTLPLLTRNVLDCTMSDFVSVIDMSFDPLLELTWETSPTDSRVNSTLGPLPADVLDLMLKGSNGSFGSIVSKFSWLLSWADKHAAFTCLSAVHNIASMLQSDSSGPGASLRRECCRKFLRSEDFWRGMFRILQMGCADLDDIQTLHIGLSGPTLSTGDRMCNAVYDLSRIFWNEDEVLATQDVTAVSILMKAGLFEAMEEALAAYGSRRLRPLNETRPEIFLNMMLGIVWRFARSDPTIVLPVLRPLLPRSRISYLLLETIFLRESPLPHYPEFKAKMPHLQMLYRVGVRTALNFYNQLEDLCRNGECGKRGADCQKLDWPEHKLICGYKNEDPTPMGGIKGGIVLPFSLRKKVENSNGRAA